MPRPAPAALRRASAAVASSASPCSCRTPPKGPTSATAAAATAAPHASSSPSAPYSTVASTSAAPVASPPPPPPPVLDFLVPGFGFFSRALPPLVSSTAPPPPPASAPTRASTHSDPARPPAPPPPPPHPRHPFAAPPPPPPLPQPHAFDVRSWRPLSVASPSAPASARTPGAPLRRSAIPLPAACVCGRVRHSCLRCRGKTTSAVQDVRTEAGAGTPEGGAPAQEDKGTPAREGKGKEVVRKPRAEGVLKDARIARDVRRTNSSSGDAPPGSPSSRLRAILAEHAPPSLPHVRGTGLIRARPPRRKQPSSRSPRTKQTLSVPEARASLDALVAAAGDDEFYHALTTREQLDLVRALSVVARAVRPFAPSDPLVPFPAQRGRREGGRDEGDAARTTLRRRAAREMLALLRRSRNSLTAFASLGTSPYSTVRQSAALLFLDAVTLADALGAIGAALLGGGADGDGTAEARELADALETLFRPPSTPLVVEQEGEVAGRDRAKALARRLENQRTAFALLLQLWRSPAGPSPYAAEQAHRLVTSYAVPPLESLFEAFVSGSSATYRAQDGFNDVLRRGYGDLLAALEPSPAAWFAERIKEGDALVDTERSGAHLVRFLAETGHPVAALDVHRAVERARSDAPPLEDVESLRTLSALVLGLTRDRLFDDAAPLATQLERVAGALQAEADAAVLRAPLDERVDGDGGRDVTDGEAGATLELVAEAYRVLAKLASDQGRNSTLERLLGRLSRLGVKPSTSLEPVARRLRVQLVRHELEQVRALFHSAEVARGNMSEGDRARLWGQLIVAHVRVNDVEGAIRTLQDLLAADLRPPLAAFNSILHGYARRGHPKPAYDLFGQLAEGAYRPLKPDATSWNALVLAHATARDPTAAEAAIAGMKASGTAPTRQTWTTLMDAYVDNGAWSAAFAVFRFLESNADPALRPDTHVANVMLKACLLTKTPAQTVLDLFRELVMRGVRPDMCTYTLVMHSLCSAGLMSAAEDLYHFIDSGDHVHGFSSRGAIRPDVFVFSALIAGYARLGNGPKARACLSEMRARGIEPSSVTVAIIVGARLERYEEDLSGTRLALALQRATAQARSFLDDATTDGDALSAVRKQRSQALEQRRVRQPVRVDRPLAAGTEAIAVFGPILRTLARTGDAADALKLFEEILDRTDVTDEDDELPMGLYTVLMTAFWQRDQPLEPLQAEAAARNVHLVWTRLYDSVARRFVRLQPVGPADPATGVEPRERRVDPAQASSLGLPLTIVIEAASRAGLHMFVEPTWRRLAREGFAFDSSNWNALALYFIHDMQLERALWITEHVLCEPTPLEALARGGDRSAGDNRGAGSSTPAATDVDDPLPAFERELGSLRRADAIGRTPARLWAGRIAAHESRRPRSQAQLLEYLASLTNGPVAHAGDGDGDPLGASLGYAIAESHKKHSATLWHPYGRTLGELQSALDLLSAQGTLRIERKYERRLARDDMPPPPMARETERGEVRRLTPQEAADAREDLQRRHPKTMRALELWRTRRERLAAERKAHDERRRGH